MIAVLRIECGDDFEWEDDDLRDLEHTILREYNVSTCTVREATVADLLTEKDRALFERAARYASFKARSAGRYSFSKYVAVKEQAAADATALRVLAGAAADAAGRDEG